MSLKKEINSKDLESIQRAITKNVDLVNKQIKWGPLFKNVSHPLHYLCDLVFANKLEDEKAGEIAQLLIDNGSNINGYGFEEMKDTPLVAAASLRADSVAQALIAAGADIHHPGCFGGTALHWASWCGRDKVVESLLREEIDLNRRCVTHKSTAFFWAAHVRLNGGEKNLHKQIECARMLKDAGADTSIPNINQITVAELLKEDHAFIEMLNR